MRIYLAGRILKSEEGEVVVCSNCGVDLTQGLCKVIARPTKTKLLKMDALQCINCHSTIPLGSAVDPLLAENESK